MTKSQLLHDVSATSAQGVPLSEMYNTYNIWCSSISSSILPMKFLTFPIPSNLSGSYTFVLINITQHVMFSQCLEDISCKLFFQ